MRLGIIRHDKHRRCAPTYEIARHAEDEIIVLVVHFLEESRARLHGDIGPRLTECRRPILHVIPIKKVWHFGPKSTRHGWHGSDDTLGRPLQHFPDEGAADAKAEYHELLDPQVIHQADLVVGV